MTSKLAVQNVPVNREMSFQVSRLMSLLRQFAGFRASQPVQRKLEKIFSQMPIADFAQWIKKIESDPQRTDLVALVEDLTNHETYFFREKVHLDALTQTLLPRLIAEKMAQPGPKKIVLWSAACSSGEEVYTLAMLALEVMAAHGIAREVRPGDYSLAADWSLEILGTDISRQAIRLAKEGIYSSRNDGLSSFRKFPADYMRFFQPVDSSKAGGFSDRLYYQVKPSLSRHVRFQMFNLVSSTPPLFDIDVIFCRNVFIYIEMDIQKLIVGMLARAMRSNGVLMLGLVDIPETAPFFSKSVLSQCVIYEKVNYVN